jgi:hypothetical protein
MNTPSALLFRHHRGQSGSVGLSPRIWDHLTEASMSPSDGGNGPLAFFEHFESFQGVVPSVSGATAGLANGFATYQDTATTASSVSQIAHEDGVVELLAGATAHHQVSAQAGGLTGAFFGIPANRGGNVRGFEARVRVPTGNTSATQGAFVGVASAGNAAVNFMANTTMALKDTNLIGFHFPVGGSNVIRPVCRKSGVAVVDTIGSVKTYVPGEWVKLGFIYNRRAQSIESLSFYVDNQLVATVTQAVVDSTYPVDALMSPILSVKSLNTTGAKLQCDWIGAYKQ